MARIQMLPDNRQLETEKDQTLLEASLSAGIPHAHACGGHGKCSSCRVIVLDGLSHCGPRNAVEQELADRLGFTPKVRLACQTTTDGDIRIRRPVLDEIDLEIVSSASRKGSESIGEEKEVTLLFADIEGYTTFTEESLPYDVVHMLNRYYYHMGKVIQEHGGYIMDYFGDGFLAIFGLRESDTHAIDGVRAGLAMRRQIQKINPYFESLFGKEFRVRIGLNTGRVILGSIGVTGMQKLAAIGDAVNFASRIEAANKDLKTHFLISSSTHDQVHDLVQIGRTFEIQVKGKQGSHTVYEVID